MKALNFFSIEEIRPQNPARSQSAVSKNHREFKEDSEQTNQVTFYELTESEPVSKKPSASFQQIHDFKDAVRFFDITDFEEVISIPEKPVDSIRTIMIVEDDGIVSTMLKHLLERRGYRTRIAPDGKRGSELIETLEPPALVLLDVMLPYVDGFELLHKIKSSEEWKNVPTIMLSAKAREEDIVRAIESGADDYIVKPFQPRELVARVARFADRGKL